MTGLPVCIAITGFTLLGGMFGAVAFGILTGTIDLRLLLSRKRGGTDFSPERAQLLVCTLAAAAYELHAIATRGDGELPDLPAPWIVLLGGSHAVYLFNKHRMGPTRQIPSDKET